MEQYQDNEINLMDYIGAISKRKWLIFRVFILTVIAAGVYSYTLPKVYRVDTLIEVGNVADSPIERVERIRARIDANFYESLLQLKLGTLGVPNIKTENPKDTNLIKLEIESADFEKNKKVLEELNNEILREHQKLVQSKRESIERDIETTEEKIKLLENTIARTENKTSALKEEKKIMEGREEGLEGVRLWDQLSQPLTGSIFTILDIREKISRKQQEINDSHIQLISLKNNKLEMESHINSSRVSLSLDFTPTTVIKSPSVSSGGQIKPRPLFNMAVAVVLGLFLGIVIALIGEWWQKASKISEV